MVRLRDAGRFSNRFNSIREAIGASSVLARLRGRPRAELARCHHMLVDALENRVLLSALPAPVTTFDQNITGGNSTAKNYNSPAIAYDPNNPNDLVEVSSTGTALQASYSIDGGASWSPIAGLPGNTTDPNTKAAYPDVSDVSVGFDLYGRAYIGYSEHNADNSDGAIVLQGFAFPSAGAPVALTLNSANVQNIVAYQWANSVDEAYTPDMAVDANSGTTPADPYAANSVNGYLAGNIYIAWASEDTLSTGATVEKPDRAMMVVSSDGGLTFSSPMEENVASTPDGPGSNDTSAEVATPKIVINQGADGIVTPGQVNIVWETLDKNTLTSNTASPGDADQFISNGSTVNGADPQLFTYYDSVTPGSTPVPSDSTSGADAYPLASSVIGALPNTAAGDSIITFSADFNKDGINDLVLLDKTSGTFQVFFGDGAADFAPGINVFVDHNSPVAVTAGDFNGDGNEDLLVIDAGGPLVLAGNGQGQFTITNGGHPWATAGTSPTYTNAGTWNVQSALIDSDNYSDLAITNANSSSFYIETDGYSPANPANVGTLAGSTLDNGLTYTTIPLAAPLTTAVTNGSTVTITEAGNTETLTLAADAGVGANTLTVTSFVANANYDGTATVVAGTNSVGLANDPIVNGATYTQLTVSGLALGIPAGATITIGTGATQQTLTLAAAAAVGDTTITVKSFTASASLATGAVVAASEVYEFNSIAYTLGGSDPQSLVLQDINGDNKIDAVIGDGDASGHVEVFPGPLTASAGPLDYKVNSPVVQIVSPLEDLNGDKRLDITAVTTTGVSVLIGKPGLVFTLSTSNPSYPTSGTLTGLTSGVFATFPTTGLDLALTNSAGYLEVLDVASSSGTSVTFGPAETIDPLTYNFPTSASPGSDDPVSVIAYTGDSTSTADLLVYDQGTASLLSYDIPLAAEQKTIPRTTDFTLPESIADANFGTLSNLSVLLQMTDSHMEQVAIELIDAKNGETYQLVLNQEKGSVPGTEVVVSPAQGISGSNGLGYLTNGRALPMYFDMEATRDITEGSGIYTSYYRPEVTTNSLDDLIGAMASDLNTTWTLRVTTYTDFTSNPPTQNLDKAGLIFTSGIIPAAPTPFATALPDALSGTGFSTQPASDPTDGVGPGISLAIDNTEGPYAENSGNLYLAVTSSVSGDTEIELYSYSYLGGWSGGTQVNNDTTTNAHFLPAVAVDQTNGTVVVTWYDARDDASDNRVARYITTSIDGGDSFGGETYLNESNTVYDAITGAAVNLGPIPENISVGTPPSAGFGDSEGLAVVGGHVYAVWAGNQNGGPTGKYGLDILTSNTTYAAGPRVVASTQGVVSTTNDIVNPAVNNTPELQYIDITFDRPIVPDAGNTYDPTDLLDYPFYFDPAALTIYYRNDSTPGTSAPTAILPLSDILSIQPLNYGTFGSAQADDDATEFRVTLVPQTAPGTYSYSITDPVESTAPVTTYAISDGYSFTGIGNFQAPYNISASASDIDAGTIGADTNLTVPATGTFEQASVITIPASLPAVDSGADGAVIEDINVTVDLVGPSDASSTLLVYLEDPNGTMVPLSLQRVGASETTADANGSNATIGGNGLISTVFDDQAGTPIAFGNYEFSGTFKPDTSDGTIDAADGGVQSLATFNGETLNATDAWTLVILDSESNNGVNKVGLLRDWSLQFTTGTLQPTLAQGGTAFNGNPMDQNSDAITGALPQIQLAASTTTGDFNGDGAQDIAQINTAPYVAKLATALTSGTTGITSLSISALNMALPSGTAIVLSSNGNTETVILNTAALAGATSLSVNTFTANANYGVGTTVQAASVSTAVAALTTALVNGHAYTSLSVSALTMPLASGTVIVLISGTNTEAVTLNGPANAGDTTLTVNSFTANFAYPSGTTVDASVVVPAVTVYIATTDGAFTTGVNYQADTDDSTPISVESVDYNNDGKLDLLITTNITTAGVTTTEDWILAGNGNGTFGIPAKISNAGVAGIAISPGTLGDAYVTPTPTSNGSFTLDPLTNSTYYAAPYESSTLPLIIPGPQALSTRSYTANTLTPTLTSALTNGETGITTLSVSALNTSLTAGSIVELVSGGNTQFVTLSDPANAGDTSLSVVSFTANADYGVGTAVDANTVAVATSSSTPSVLTSTLTIGGDSDVDISKLSIDLNLSSTTDVSQLVIQLIYTPANGGDSIPITLVDEPAGGGAAFGTTFAGETIPVIFTDDGPTSIQLNPASQLINGNYAGFYQPATPLSALNGQLLAGTYELVIRNYDTSAGDTATLNSWSINAATTISAVDPNSGAGVNSVDVHFTQPMDPGTVDNAGVTLTGPDGPVTGTTFTITGDPNYDPNNPDFQAIGTLTGALASGATNVTSINVTALTTPLLSGTAIVLGTGTDAEIVILSAPAAVGDTTLSVVNFNVDAFDGIAAGTTVQAVNALSSDAVIVSNINSGATGVTALSISPLMTALPVGTPIVLSSNGSSQTVILSSAAPAGATTLSVQSFTANFDIAPGATVQNFSALSTYTTLSSAVTQGIFTLELSVNPLTMPMAAGTTVVLNSGTNTENAELFEDAPAGATTLEVFFSNLAPDFDFPAGTVIESLDYSTYKISFSSPLTLTGGYSLVLGNSATANGEPESATGVAIDSNADDGLNILRAQATSSSNDRQIAVSSTNVGQTISKYNGNDGIVQSTVQVGGAGGNTLTDVTSSSNKFAVTGEAQNYLISGLTVTVQLSYPLASELTLILISPDGTAVQLFSNLASTGKLVAGDTITFSDTASVAITSGAAPFLGIFSPEEPLSAFNGELASGTWTLQIKDNGTNSGTLTGWSMQFTAYNPDSATSQPGDAATVGINVFNMGATNPQSHETWNPVGGSSNATGSASASGPVSTIAVDPSDSTGNTVYVGAATGGVWKTTNFLTTDPNGPTYVPLTNFLGTNTSNIGSIAVLGSQTNPATGLTVPSAIFAGTGELYDVNSAGQMSADNAPGAGILISLDGGLTWTVNDDKGAFDGLIANKVIVDPNLQANGDAIVYVAFTDPQNEAGTKVTDNGGVYVSTDSGQTWTSLKNGQATDIAFEENSGVGAFQQGVANPTHNLNGIVAAFEGSGVYYSPNRGSTWTALTGTGYDPLILNGTTPVTVSNSSKVLPGQNQGRVVLATPALTGNSVEDLLYEGWIYAAVVKPAATTGGIAGTLFGLYMTKDNGNTWTEIDLTANVTNGVTTSGISVSAGNYALALSVDPTDPNVVYLASTSLDGAGAGMVRIDTTGISDAHSFYVGETNPTSNALHVNNNGVAVYNNTNGAYSNPIADPTINLIQNPSEPFVTNATLKVSDISSFANTGKGISWEVFTGASTDATFYHTIVAEVDPLTGEPRLILGTEQGVFTGVDDDGTYEDVNANNQQPVGSTTNASLSETPLGSRNGNLQIAEFYYGAVQPSQNAADIAGSLVYGNAQGAGLSSSTSDILSTGNTDWNSHAPSGGTGVATDPTGSGAVYNYANPLESGAGTNFFQVNGVGRTTGLITVNDAGTDTTNDSEWPDLSTTGNGTTGYNFAVNPLNGDQIVISSSTGEIYSTQDQGEHWSLITSTTGLDANSNAITLAYGAPTNQSANGNFIYAATLKGDIYVTFTGGGEDNSTWYPIANTKMAPGDYVEAIAPDPTPGSYDVYAVTQHGVYYLSNAYEFATNTKDPVTGKVPAWVAITSNLPKLTGTPTTGTNLLTTMTADWRYFTPVLYVGADSGVYRGIEDNTTGTWNWTLFPNVATDSAPVDGGDLPNVEITDLDLATGNVNTTTGLPQTADGDPDALVASTFGRGAYAIRLAPIVASATAAVPTGSPSSYQAITTGASSYITNDTILTLSGSSERLIAGYNQADISIYLLDVNGTPLATPEFLGGYNPADASTNPADPNGQFNLNNIANASGNFAITLTNPLPTTNGNYTIGIQATDNAGVVGAYSALNVALEVTPPVITSLALTAATDTGADDTDGLTRNNKPEVVGQGAAGATATIYLNGTPQGTAVADATGQFLYQFTTALPDDSYLVSASEVDTFNNPSLAPNISFAMTIVTSAAVPTAPVLSSFDSGLSATDNITNDPFLSFAGDGASDNVGAYNTVTVTITPTTGAPTVLTAVADSSGTYYTGQTVALPDGVYTVTATQTDIEGNTSVASPATTVVINTANPTVFATNFSTSQFGTYSGVVGTFTDESPANADVTVYWGDGSHSSTDDGLGDVTISQGTGSTWNINGTHVYENQETDNTYIIVEDTAGNTSVSSIDGTVTVGPPAITVQAQNYHVKVGSEFSESIATFSSGVTSPPQDATDFDVTIDWGDGTTPASDTDGLGDVTIVQQGTSTEFTINATHTYSGTTLHTYQATITVSSNDYTASPGSTTSSIVVTPATQLVTVQAQTAYSGNEGVSPAPLIVIADVSNNGDLSTDDFANDFSTTDFSTPMINWGDGTQGNPDITSGTIVADGAGGFFIEGTHDYDDGNATGTHYTITTSVKLDGTTLTVPSNSATITDVAPQVQSVTGTNFALVNQPVTLTINTTDASQTDTARGFTYSINWGDGTITSTPTHSYTTANTYNISVTAKDKDNVSSPAFTGYSVDIAQLQAAGSNIPASEGTSTGNVVLATLVGATVAPNSATFPVTVNWDDGTTPDTNVTYVASGNNYLIEDSHTYADGPHNYSITVSAQPVGDAATTVNDTANVINLPPTLAFNGTPPAKALVGQTINVPITTTDPGTVDTSTGFTYSVIWGDNGTTAQPIPAAPSNGTGYAPPHVYAAAGNYPVSITATDKDSAVSNTISSTIQVAGLSASNISMAEGSPFSGTVATISNASSFTAGDFTASINWGDGTTTVGTITSNGDGTFSITGAHTYADGPAADSVVTTLSFGSASATATGTATVSDVAPTAALSGPSFALSGQPVMFLIGASDAGSADTAAGFKYVVNFGDGTSQTVLAAPGNNTGQPVTHTYSSGGNYNVSVTATDKDGVASSAASQSIAVAGIASASLADVSEGSTFSGRVASVTNAGNYSATSFSASINWGDGSAATTGTISPDPNNAGTFLISGSHSFGDGPAADTVTVTVTSASGTVVSTSTLKVDNIAPTVSLSAAAGGFTGQSLPLTISATDPSSADTAAGFTYQINWGDGATQTIGTTSNNGGGVTPTHTYAALGNYTVTVTATDKDGGVSTAATHGIDIVAATQIQNFAASANSISFTLPQTAAPITSLNSSDFTLVRDGSQIISLANAPVTFDPSTGNVSINTSGLNLPAGDYQIFPLPGTQILPGSFSIGINESALLTKVVKLNPGKKVKAAAIKFPKLTVGGAAEAPVVLALENISTTQSLTLSQFAFLSSGPFSFAVENQPYGATSYTIGAGQTLYVRVYYTPTVAGSSSNKLKAQFNNGLALNYGAVVAKFSGKAVNPKVTSSITKKILKGDKSK